MGEFASKGVAGTGLGLGIAGTALGVLAGSNNGNGNGGLLGGLFGNNNCSNEITALSSEIAKLRAEKYSDRNTADVYSALRNEVGGLGERLLEKYISPLSQESAENRTRVAVLEAKQQCDNEKALLREQLIEAKIDNCCCRMNAKIDTVAQTASCGIAQNSAAIASLQNTVNSITGTVIPQSVICPPVMPRYNTWTAPTDTAPATQPISGTVTVNKK